jgi:integrase
MDSQWFHGRKKGRPRNVMSTEPIPITNTVIRHLSAIRLDELNDARKLGKMPLREAAKVWLETRRPFIGPRTAKDYRSYIETLVKFFGNVQLEKLGNPDLLRAYQLERSKTCSGGAVNKELGIVQQLLKRIRKWDAVKPFYEPLEQRIESPGRALTPEEERALLKAGTSRPGWARAYYLTILSINTAAGPGELLGLRLRDVFVDNPETARIYMHENAKNKYRIREVPLNADAVAAVIALLKLAKEVGATQPDHYLIPYRVHRSEFDPTRHGFWPKTAWNEICAAAGVKVRPYDLRHHALTKLAEKNPEQVVLKIAGHVSPQMLRKVYAHVRLPALRAGVDSISSVSGEPNKSTAVKSEQALFRVAQMAESMGISSDKALELLLEYERSKQTLRKETK